MSGAVSRRIAWAEPISVFVMIMAYIWALRYRHPAFWLMPLGLMLASHAIRHERAEALGFHLRNLRKCWIEFAPFLAFVALSMVCSGMLLQTTRPMRFERAILAWFAYFPWGLFQQYILNGYFLNRFDGVVSRRTAPVLSAALFSGAHVPNWFLMFITLALGYCCARVYRRYNNLYFLGLAHATVGFLLYLVVPDSISHHLKVGPGWFVQ
jgi:hypothetical protein